MHGAAAEHEGEDPLSGAPASMLAVMVADAETLTTILASPHAASMLGCAADELASLNLLTLAPDIAASGWADMAKPPLRQWKASLVARNGQRLHVRLAVCRMVGGARECLHVSIEREHPSAAEESRMLGAALLRSVIDTAPDAIITISRAGQVDGFSPAAERMFGYRADEVVGQNVSMLMPEPYRSQHDGYLARYLATREKRIIGIGRTVSARHRWGHIERR